MIALLALSLITPISAQSSNSDSVRFRGFPILISHLSPLLNYSPADAWSHNAYGSNTTSPSANVSFSTTERQLLVNGAFEGDAQWKAEPEYKQNGAFTEVRWNGTAIGWNVMLETSAGSQDVASREITLTNGDEQGDWMRMEGVQMFASLPVVDGDVANPITRQSAVLSNGSVNTFFTSPTSDWSIANNTPPSIAGQETLLPSANVSTIPSIWYGDQFLPPFPTNSTLTTTTVDSPLVFDVPTNTALLQWYGTVGPSYGRFELKLIPQGPEMEYPLSRGEYTASAEREVEAGLELMMIAFPDPRVRYTAEIRLLEEGKRVDVNGMFLTSFLDDPDALGGGNFVQAYNDRVMTVSLALLL